VLRTVVARLDQSKVRLPALAYGPGQHGNHGYSLAISACRLAAKLGGGYSTQRYKRGPEEIRDNYMTVMLKCRNDFVDYGK
jgi:hypothetical protein